MSFFLNALAQRKVDQVVHILRIKYLGELSFVHKLKRNFHRLKVKFLQRRCLLICLYPNGKVHVGHACIQYRLEQAQNLLHRLRIVRNMHRLQIFCALCLIELCQRTGGLLSFGINCFCLSVDCHFNRSSIGCDLTDAAGRCFWHIDAANVALGEEDLISGERLTAEDFPKAADNNLAAALDNSTFTLKEKIAFFKKKWLHEHIAAIVLCVAAWIGVVTLLAIKTRGNDGSMVLGAVGGLLAVLFYVVLYNRMMAYVEHRAYRTAPDKETEKMTEITT